MIKTIIKILGFTALMLTASSAISEEIVDRTVAIANDDIILQSELDKAEVIFKKNLTQQGIEIPDEETLRKNTLERLIINSLILQLASKNGITMSNTDLDRAIANLAESKNTTPEKMLSNAEKAGYSEAEFRKEIKKDILINEISRAQVRNRIHISDQEVEQLAVTLKEHSKDMKSYHLGVIFIKLPNSPTPAQADSAKRRMTQVLNEIKAGQEFDNLARKFSEAPNNINGGDLGQIPESNLPSYISEAAKNHEAGDLIGPIRTEEGLSLFHIYSIDKMALEPIEQVKVRHILLKTSIIFDDKKAEAKLLQFRNEIENGDKSFADLASNYSEDPGSSYNGGLIDWTNPDIFDPSFKNEIKKLQPGQISMPFESSFGWHIVKLEGRKIDQDSLEAYRIKAREIILNRSMSEEMQRWQQELRDTAYVKIFND